VNTTKTRFGKDARALAWHLLFIARDRAESVVATVAAGLLAASLVACAAPLDTRNVAESRPSNEVRSAPSSAGDERSSMADAVEGRAPVVAESERDGMLRSFGAPTPSTQGSAASTTAEVEAMGRPDAMGLGRRGMRIAVMPYAAAQPTFDTEQYDHIEETGFREVAHNPLSTFSIDVDTASYSNVRRILTGGSLPTPGAVRIEEMINYFDYEYAEPSDDRPFSVTTELSDAPWNPQHRLLLVGLRGRRIPQESVPPRNLVFLIDVSGSMNSPDKLPLVTAGLRKLARTLRPRDHVSIVVYAGASGLVLEPTSGRERERVEAALERLGAGGSTNGAGGIRLAYETARRYFDPHAINRVILATDGDFNVGTTSRDELVRLIESERESGVYLTVLGVGAGNLKDATMEDLADHGNGNYAYLDSAAEARKVLIEEAGSTLATIADDVKVQIEFNPAAVGAYRLIGYENRRLADRDFNDDTKDAGEIGAGHTVTALYEIVPAGVSVPGPRVDPLRYKPDRGAAHDAENRVDAEPLYSKELATVKLRYKRAGEGRAAARSELISRTVGLEYADIDSASENLRFAAAVAAFGLVLTDSEHRADASLAMAAGLARSALGSDPHAYRAEFLRLVAIADGLAPRAQLR